MTSNCSICLEEISRSDMCVCLQCGENFHNSCWTEFKNSTQQRIINDDPLDPSNYQKVEAQCPKCRAPEHRLVKIGDSTAAVPAPASAPRRDRYHNRYADEPERQCKKCPAVLRAGHPGHYCSRCHREHRRYGDRGRLQGVDPPRRERKCGSCGMRGHDKRTCPRERGFA